MGYSSSEIFDFQANAFQFKKWLESEEDNTNYMTHAKKAVSVAINEELTETQRIYFTMYFLERRTISQIANLYGVNKSTVSRTLKVAKNKLARVLKYSAPNLLNAFVEKRNKRSKK